MLRGLMNPTSMVVVVTDAIAAALPALYVVLSAVSGIALLLVLEAPDCRGAAASGVGAAP